MMMAGESWGWDLVCLRSEECYFMEGERGLKVLRCKNL